MCRVRTSLIVLWCASDICREKPKLHYADFSQNFPMTRVAGKFWRCQRLVTGKSPTWIMLRGSHGDVSGVSNHRDISRCFEKFRHVGNQPVCVGETGKSATSATRHGKVGDVVDKATRGPHGFDADLSRTSRGSRNSGIWA